VSAIVKRPIEAGSADCSRSTVASVDGPARSGIARGTTNGSPSREGPSSPPSPRKDHSQRDEKQDDSARDTDGLLFEAEESQKVFADQQEGDEDEVCEANLAEQHGAAPFRADSLENRQEQWGRSREIHDQKQRYDGGDQVNSPVSVCGNHRRQDNAQPESVSGESEPGRRPESQIHEVSSEIQYQHRADNAEAPESRRVRTL